MATLLMSNGKKSIILPANGENFTIEEINNYIRGNTGVILIPFERKVFYYSIELQRTNAPINNLATRECERLLSGNVMQLTPEERYAVLKPLFESRGQYALADRIKEELNWFK